jgi:hypothetical protein
LFSESQSGRGTNFIPLPLLDGHALFKKHPMYQEHAVVRSFVADLGGHARSLNELLRVLETFREEPTQTTLSDALLDRLWDFGSGPLPAQLIIRAVLRLQIHLDEVIGEKNETVETYVANVCLFALILRIFIMI